jgi:hypothetical protein
MNKKGQPMVANSPSALKEKPAFSKKALSAKQKSSL